MNKTITVTEVIQGKFGPQVKDGKAYFSYSKKFSGVPLKVGDVAEVDLFVTEKGNNYINSVIKASTAITTPSAPVSAAPAKKAPVAKEKVSADMSRADWDAKDRRISRQGVIQVAVQVTNSFEDAVVLADKMLDFVNEAK